MEELALSKFSKYLQIKTVHPTPDYDKAVEFLDEYAKELGLVVQREPKSEKINEIVVMTWHGTNSEMSSILLNSHTDVVPIYPEHWKFDAFAAVKDNDGNIYGRGTQDMKCVGIQYLEAIRNLKQMGVQCQRDIHVCYVPDEEIGGEKGMQAFMETDLFKRLNVGFVLDEGLANPDNMYSVFYGERAPWWVEVKCSGNPGHGSRFIENNAPEKLRKILNTVLEYREQEKNRLEENKACISLGEVTTVNLTGVEGGVAHNLVPADLTATFDFRIAPSVDLEKFEEQLARWCKDAGDDVTYSFIQKTTKTYMTSTDDEDPWWKAFEGACKKFGVEIRKDVFPAATDSRFLRAAGFPAVGFSPMRNTPILLHDHNEFINERVFLEGIRCYCDVIPAVANVPAF